MRRYFFGAIVFVFSYRLWGKGKMMKWEINVWKYYHINIEGADWYVFLFKKIYKYF